MIPVLIVLRIAGIIFALEGLIMLTLGLLSPMVRALGPVSEWALAALDADPGVELTADEVSAVQRDQGQKFGFRLRTPEPLDVGDPLVASHQSCAHSASTWAVNSRPSHSARRPREVELTP